MAYRNKALKELAALVDTCPWCGEWAEPGSIVGCHPNSLKYGKGMGLKADDLVAFLCPKCHDQLDGRSGTLTRHEKEQMFLGAFYESMLWAFSNGHIKVVK